MKNILETINLNKHYGKGESLVKAIDNTNIKIKEGEFVAIVGKSGSGKSTLLHMLGALDRPTSGKVLIDNNDISNMKEEQLAVFRRRKIGFVFQSFNLIPVLTVEEVSYINAFKLMRVSLHEKLVLRYILIVPSSL